MELPHIDHGVSCESESADILGDVFTSHFKFGVAHLDVGLVVESVGCRNKQRTALQIDDLCRAEGVCCVGFEGAGFDCGRPSVGIARAENECAFSRLSEGFITCDDY